MCDQTEVQYLPGEIVWVKLRGLWWPGKVQDYDSLPEEITSSLRRRPIATVKFFQEESYEYVNKLDLIYHYNCSRKLEFIKKGLDLSRKKSADRPSNVDFFASDVATAEALTGGDPNIIHHDAFKPEEKPKYESLFGEKKKLGKKKGKEKEKPLKRFRLSSSTPPAVGWQSRGSSPNIIKPPPNIPRVITHPRFLAKAQNGKSDYEVHISIQKTNDDDAKLSEKVYQCCLCGYHTCRLNVIILHFNTTHSVKLNAAFPHPKTLKSRVSRTPFSKTKTDSRKSESKLETKAQNVAEADDDGLQTSQPTDVEMDDSERFKEKPIKKEEKPSKRGRKRKLVKDDVDGLEHDPKKPKVVDSLLADWEEDTEQEQVEIEREKEREKEQERLRKEEESRIAAEAAAASATKSKEVFEFDDNDDDAIDLDLTPNVKGFGRRLPRVIDSSKGKNQALLEAKKPSKSRHARKETGNNVADVDSILAETSVPSLPSIPKSSTFSLDVDFEEGKADLVSDHGVARQQPVSSVDATAIGSDGVCGIEKDADANTEISKNCSPEVESAVVVTVPPQGDAETSTEKKDTFEPALNEALESSGDITVKSRDWSPNTHKSVKDKSEPSKPGKRSSKPVEIVKDHAEETLKSGNKSPKALGTGQSTGGGDHNYVIGGNSSRRRRRSLLPIDRQYDLDILSLPVVLSDDFSVEESPRVSKVPVLPALSGSEKGSSSGRKRRGKAPSSSKAATSKSEENIKHKSLHSLKSPNSSVSKHSRSPSSKSRVKSTSSATHSPSTASSKSHTAKKMKIISPLIDSKTISPTITPSSPLSATMFLSGAKSPLSIDNPKSPSMTRQKSPAPSVSPRSPPPLSGPKSPPPLSGQKSPTPMSDPKSSPPLSGQKSPLPLSRQRSPPPLTGHKSPPHLIGSKSPPPLTGHKSPPPVTGPKSPPHVTGPKSPPHVTGPKSPPHVTGPKSPPPPANQKSPKSLMSPKGAMQVEPKSPPPSAVVTSVSKSFSPGLKGSKSPRPSSDVKCLKGSAVNQGPKTPTLMISPKLTPAGSPVKSIPAHTSIATSSPSKVLCIPNTTAADIVSTPKISTPGSGSPPPLVLTTPGKPSTSTVSPSKTSTAQGSIKTIKVSMAGTRGGSPLLMQKSGSQPRKLMIVQGKAGSSPKMLVPSSQQQLLMQTIGSGKKIVLLTKSSANLVLSPHQQKFTTAGGKVTTGIGTVKSVLSTVSKDSGVKPSTSSSPLAGGSSSPPALIKTDAKKTLKIIKSMTPSTQGAKGNVVLNTNSGQILVPVSSIASGSTVLSPVSTAGGSKFVLPVGAKIVKNKAGGGGKMIFQMQSSQSKLMLPTKAGSKSPQFKFVTQPAQSPKLASPPAQPVPQLQAASPSCKTVKIKSGTPVKQAKAATLPKPQKRANVAPKPILQPTSPAGEKLTASVSPTSGQKTANVVQVQSKGKQTTGILPNPNLKPVTAQAQSKATAGAKKTVSMPKVPLTESSTVPDGGNVQVVSNIPVNLEQIQTNLLAADTSGTVGLPSSSQQLVTVSTEDGGQLMYLIDNSALLGLDGATQAADGSPRTLIIDPASLGSSQGNLQNLILTFDNLAQPSVSSSDFSFPTPSSGQDILAEALANTQVLQSDVSSSDLSLDTSGLLSPHSAAAIYQSPVPTLSHGVLETSLTLNQPIMTPLQDLSAVSSLQPPPITPTSLDLPITITQPDITISTSSYSSLPIPSATIQSTVFSDAQQVASYNPTVQMLTDADTDSGSAFIESAVQEGETFVTSEGAFETPSESASMPLLDTP